MADRTRDVEEVADPEPSEDLLTLYRRAFVEFGTRCLWNVRQFDEPTPSDILSIARPLRIEGNMAARRLAERIERLARADH